MIDTRKLTRSVDRAKGSGVDVTSAGHVGGAGFRHRLPTPFGIQPAVRTDLKLGELRAAPSNVARPHTLPEGDGINRGFSLLEVVLALAILSGAIVVIGELVRLGTRNAEAARDLSQAQLLCESKLAEIASGMTAAEPVSQALCPDDENWLYSITVESTDQAGLVEVRVTFTRNLPAHLQPVDFSLVQWMPDPAAATSSATTTQGESSSSATTGVGNG